MTIEIRKKRLDVPFKNNIESNKFKTSTSLTIPQNLAYVLMSEQKKFFKTKSSCVEYFLDKGILAELNGKTLIEKQQEKQVNITWCVLLSSKTLSHLTNNKKFKKRVQAAIYYLKLGIQEEL